MFIEKNLAFDQSDIDGHNEIQSKTLNEVIAIAGGMAALANTLNVSEETVMRWKNQRGVPIFHALEIQYLFDVPYIDLIRHEEALPLSLAIIRQTYGRLKPILEKKLQQLEVDATETFELLEEITALAKPFVGSEA